MSSPIFRNASYRRINFSLIWALLGFLFFYFEIYVLIRWVGSANFRAIAVDPASVPDLARLVIDITQWVSPILTALIVLKFLVLPWLRTGRPTTDGMLVLAYMFLWFQDPLGNFIHTQLYYSSYWFNRGSWTYGSFPGWVSSHGNHLPEPILVMGFGYLWLGFTAALIACNAMQWTKKHFPHTNNLVLICVALCIGVTLDVVAEVALAATGTFAWPGVIKGLTLFYGEPYQFPMTEGGLFGATIVSGGVLRFFRDDKGLTLVERGIAQVTLPTQGKMAIKFFAIFGFMHLFMLLVYSVPMAVLGTYTTINQRYPSHLENGMCVAGPHDEPCPGPVINTPALPDGIKGNGH